MDRLRAQGCVFGPLVCGAAVANVFFSFAQADCKVINFLQKGKGKHSIVTKKWLRGEKMDVLLMPEGVSTDYAMETQDFFCHPRF